MELQKNIKLKVCGVRDSANILQVASTSPDYMGFIFYPKSPRYVGEDFSIPEKFPGAIKRVGVFVNESTESIVKKTEHLSIHYLQLHGAETVKQCVELKKHNYKIIKVFSVDDEFKFEVTKPYYEVADYFLFDTKGKYYGGNAEAFNWRILEQYDQQVPFFLSGGIGPENVTEVKAMADMNLHAIDVNSAVELEPALKSTSKIEAIQHILNS